MTLSTFFREFQYLVHDDPIPCENPLSLDPTRYWLSPDCYFVRHLLQRIPRGEEDTGLLGERTKFMWDEEELDPEDDGSTFLGYINPSSTELSGKASRTELFQCHKCGHYTRFPRYNTVSSIIGYKRGRCGEYSMLLYRILRALGHEARWIVDWADHVWAECFFPDSTSYDVDKKGRWVHLGTVLRKLYF
jgi:peptide-N4-(N-acetyl-beta-glucosaminyl)asparagine amidase